MKLGGFRGVREDRTDHTNLFPRSFTGSGLTKHQKTRLSLCSSFLKLTSAQNTFKWAPNGGPKGPLPWDPLGSQGSPPMGPLGLPRVPSHGIPWAPKSPPTPNGVFGNLMSVSSYLFGHDLAAAAPGHGQVALRAKKVALGPGPPGPGPAAVQVRATLFGPSATWPCPGAAAARPWPNK